MNFKLPDDLIDIDKDYKNKLRKHIYNEWESYKDTIELRKRGRIYKIDFYFLNFRVQRSLMTDNILKARKNLEIFKENYADVHLKLLKDYRNPDEFRRNMRSYNKAIKKMFK